MAKTALVSLDEFMIFGPHELLIQKVINFMCSYVRDLYILKSYTTAYHNQIFMAETDYAHKK